MTRSTPLDIALEFIGLGWSPVPLPFRKKRPVIEGWKALRITAETAPRYFNGAAMNIGLILGEASGGLTDADLDCDEAVRAAPYLLPRTHCFGRPGKRCSHWLYVTDLASTHDKAAIQFKDGATVLLEIRIGATGAQTMAPGSTHPSGEPVAWEDRNPVAEIGGDDLLARGARLAAVSILARHFPQQGGRHDAGLVIGGFLARCNYSESQARLFAEALCAATQQDRDKTRDIVRAVEDSIRDFAAGKPVAGFPKLVETFGKPAARKTAEWLGYDADEGAEKRSKKKPKPNGGCPYGPTEDGMALAFVAQYAGEFIFDHHRGKWFRWDGTRWAQEDTQLVRDLARDLCRAKATTLDSPGDLLKWKTTVAVEAAVRGDRRMAVTSAFFDRDPYLLGTPDGVVDLRSGQVRAGRPEDGISKITAVAPAPPGTPCPIWLGFLDEATRGDAGLIRFLQQSAGYALTGDCREECFWFFHGPGGNGKGVFLGAVSTVMGQYAVVSDMDLFMESFSQQHPTGLADLAGARLVKATETTEGRRWALGKLKELTGNEGKIKARRMRQDFFEFDPTHKLFFAGNRKPKIPTVDQAMARRLNLVPFTFRPATDDKTLKTRLVDEYPAILRWMLDGCTDWQANGLIRPAVVTEATKEYLADEDIKQRWLDDRCVLRADAEALQSALFSDLKQWCEAAGERPGTSQAMKGWLADTHGVRSAGHTKKGNLLQGVSLTDEAEMEREFRANQGNRQDSGW